MEDADVQHMDEMWGERVMKLKAADAESFGDSMLEEFPLPTIENRWIEAIFITDIRNWLCFCGSKSGLIFIITSHI